LVAGTVMNSQVALNVFKHGLLKDDKNCMQLPKSVENICVTNLKCSIAHSLIRMIEEVMKNIKDRCLRQNKLLQILWVEVMTIHVHCREEDGFHLVMPKLISWLVSCNQNLVTNKTIINIKGIIPVTYYTLYSDKVCVFYIL
jgi:hypothetical protein